jgi:hypothetical protein
VGDDIARLRMFFALSRDMDNGAIVQWGKELAAKHPELNIDPSVLEASTFIYTSRPKFEGRKDPVPPEQWVFVLDGPAEFYSGIRPSGNGAANADKSHGTAGNGALPSATADSGQIDT